jgi:hypothetical protein
MDVDRKTRTEAGIVDLANAAGTAEAVSRGQTIAFAIVVVGMLGAVGAALRPLYRHHFVKSARGTPSRSADAARRAIAFERDGIVASTDTARLEQAQKRLRELQASHMARNPYLYVDGVPIASFDGAAVTDGQTSAKPRLQ